jgi:hypothetical protein
LAVFAIFSGAHRGGKNASLAAQELRSHAFASPLIAALLLVISRCRLPLRACLQQKKEFAWAPRL